MTDEGTSEGTGTGAGTGQVEAPAWLAQMPADLKSNEAFKPYKTIGDLGKSYLELQGKVSEVDGLKAKLGTAIFKPGDKATPEEITAFHKSLGVPEKADEYEFPKGEGVAHDPKMIDWAKGTFHEAKLTKEQASVVSKKWDAFMQQMAVAENEAVEKELTDANNKLKEEWKADYDKNLELSSRAFKHFANAELGEFKAHPVLIKAFHAIGKAMGEDFSPTGLHNKGTTPKEGFVYDKSPDPFK